LESSIFVEMLNEVSQGTEGKRDSARKIVHRTEGIKVNAKKEIITLIRASHKEKRGAVPGPKRDVPQCG